MGILTHYFPPTSNYIVAPEYYVKAGKRGDAMVIDGTGGHLKLVLAFEGKADPTMAGGTEWGKRVVQLKGYTGDVVKSAPFNKQR